MQNPEQIIDQLRAENTELRNQLEVYRRALEKHLPIYEGDESEFAEILAHPERHEPIADILAELDAERNNLAAGHGK